MRVEIKTRSVLLAVDSDNEGLEGGGGNAVRRRVESVSSALSGRGEGKGRWEGAHVSACNTAIPVTSSTGIFLVSISTTRIRDVMEKTPPCLYMDSLYRRTKKVNFVFLP